MGQKFQTSKRAQKYLNNSTTFRFDSCWCENVRRKNTSNRIFSAKRKRVKIVHTRGPRFRNTPKYTTSIPYWMLNNLLFRISFCMRNNLNVIIKIFSTIYLSRAVLFTSVPLEGMPIFLLVTIGIMSLGSTKLEKCPRNG